MSSFVETYRGSVAATECDQYGHMNVQFYTARVSDAAASAMLAAGFGQKAFLEHKLGIVAVNAEMKYLSELHAGDMIRVESGVRSAEGRKIRFQHRLYNAESGALCMQADVLGLCFDLEQRKSVPLPADIQAGFETLRVSGEEPAGAVALPPAEQGFVPSGRAPVQPWECDHMGHLNVQFYLARFAEAEKQVLLALGYGPTRRRTDRVAVRPLKHRIQFKRENHEGAVLRLRSGIRAVEADRLHLYHELYEDETGTLSATCEATVILDALDGSGAFALPADVKQAAGKLAAQLVAPPPPGPTGSLPPPSAPVEGMFETCRGSVDKWEAEETGRMATRFYIARFSEAAGNMLAGGDMTAEQMRQQGLGSAALDYTIDYFQPLHVGDAYYTRTGMLELREKTWRFCHFLLDSNTRQPLARAEIIAVLFDLKARKSIVMPDHVRQSFSTRLVTPQPVE
ncbi:thioesterase family protein [Ferrovibrio sp.]|uniref:acyl-CoA thioesterase n=1 Tax=Ferrovibrio sp. TaxID=1917215 RepID=UPI002635CC5D|nr:thioesterase family protein [Ferrovibrio sp.]